MPTIDRDPTPDAPFVAIKSAAKMPSTCWGRYEHIACVETDGKTKPKMLSTRAKGVKRIVWAEARAHVGAERSAAAVAWNRAQRLADHNNQLHQHRTGIKPVTALDIDKASNEHFRRDLIEAFGGEMAYIETPGTVVVNRDRCGILVFRMSGVEAQTEPYCAVLVTCPSTGKRYALRVPPSCSSATEAVAWGFNIPPHLYRPSVET